MMPPTPDQRDLSPRGLTLCALSVTRAGKPLVALDTHIAPGTVLTIMGPSGSGKSTALAAIIGTLGRDFRLSGHILLDGQEVSHLPTRARRIGLLFQDDVLFPHLSVAGNLGFALPRHIRGRAARRARIDAALEKADLAGFGDRDPATLSGGQRARVALLRTLLAEPRALLLDEPFSRLDASLRAQIRSFVLTCARDEGLPVILVTHDAEDARAAGGPIFSPLGVPICPHQ
jgi:putative thiamine transport system ATP-binding protein